MTAACTVPVFILHTETQMLIEVTDQRFGFCKQHMFIDNTLFVTFLAQTEL